MRVLDALVAGVLGVTVVGAGPAWAAQPAADLLRDAAWAEEVVQYDPGFGGLKPSRNVDPKKALTRPNGKSDDVSLGRGGLLELAWVTTTLTNSGDDLPDLSIHEAGPDVEGVLLAVQPADQDTARALAFSCKDERKPFHDGFCEIGFTGGGTTHIDLDAFFPGFPKGTLRFNAVQIVDDELQGAGKGTTVGADIDAVRALFTAPAPAAGTWGYWGPAPQGKTTLPPAAAPRAPQAPAATGHHGTVSFPTPVAAPALPALTTPGTPSLVPHHGVMIPHPAHPAVPAAPKTAAPAVTTR